MVSRSQMLAVATIVRVTTANVPLRPACVVVGVLTISR
ncbi:hypothetical protein BZL30_9425 [Mycobacterium kansasii]|uniref:Uncharacterized protein n=1 Tax=Mycobacterium kansasii TaxID=1768 RepID=A0A1V3WB41_MYCKA|nr:hypothetical protein BZL30_9425 [Mycobacterium kansasii]